MILLKISYLLLLCGKTIGFKVSYINGIENFSLMGKLNLNYATNIWGKFIEKKDEPDIDLTIEDFLE